MSRGQPLTDDDRYPWLVRIREVAVDRVKELACEEGGEGKSKKRRCLIVACSALKKSYRDVLRGIPPHATPHDLPQSEEAEASDGPALSTFFVFIDGSRSLLEERMNARQGHFMKTAMLDSQLKTLEPPNTTGEENVITVYLEDHIDDQVRMAEEKLKEAGAVAAE
jgi:gluconokinase